MNRNSRIFNAQNRPELEFRTASNIHINLIYMNTSPKIHNSLNYSMPLHLMFTYKGKFYSRHKYWTFETAEAVLTRIGASYWELG
jgi:hypothetical protein